MAVWNVVASSNASPEDAQLSTEVSVCNMYVYTQIFESTRIVQRSCVAEAVSSDFVPCCRRRLSTQLPEAVRPLHLSQMWTQVLQSLLLPIRGER